MIGEIKRFGLQSNYRPARYTEKLPSAPCDAQTKVIFSLAIKIRGNKRIHHVHKILLSIKTKLKAVITIKAKESKIELNAQQKSQ